MAATGAGAGAAEADCPLPPGPPFEDDAPHHAWVIASVKKARSAMESLETAIKNEVKTDSFHLLGNLKYIQSIIEQQKRILARLPIPADARRGAGVANQVGLADINARGPKGSTPLMMLCAQGLDAAEVEVSELLTLGADPTQIAYEFNDDVAAANIDMKDFETPLITAAFKGHEKICKVLLQWRGEKLKEKGVRLQDVARVDPNYRMSGSFRSGASAMLAACDAGHLQVVKLLMKHGGDPALHSTRRRPDDDDDGDDDAHSIVAAGGAPGVDVLGRRAAAAAAAAAAGNTPENPDGNDDGFGGGSSSSSEDAGVDAELGEFGRLDYDSEASDDDTCLSAACENGRLEVVQELLSNSSAATCLENHTAIVKLLLAHGGDANSNGVPLYVAASNNNLALIQVLVEHNADVNAEVTGLQSTNGTPLHGACYTGWYNAAISLAVLGANRGEADQNGETPLHKTRRMAKVRLQTQHAALSEWLERTERWSPLRIAASHQRCEEAALALRLGLVLPPTAWGDVKAVLDSAAAGKSETERAAEASAGGGTFGTDWMWLAILGFVERSWMPGAVKKAWKQPHNATPTTYSFDFN
eukprot:gene12945-15400_t